MSKKLIEMPNYKKMGNIFITVEQHKKTFIATYVHDMEPNFGRGCGGIGKTEEESITKLLGVLDKIYGESV